MAEFSVPKDDIAYLRIAQLEAALAKLANPSPMTPIRPGQELDRAGEAEARQAYAKAALDGDLRPFHEAAMQNDPAVVSIEPYVAKVDHAIDKLAELNWDEKWMAVQHGVQKRDTELPARTANYLKAAQAELRGPSAPVLSVPQALAALRDFRDASWRGLTTPAMRDSLTELRHLYADLEHNYKRRHQPDAKPVELKHFKPLVGAPIGMESSVASALSHLAPVAGEAEMARLREMHRSYAKHVAARGTIRVAIQNDGKLWGGDIDETFGAEAARTDSGRWFEVTTPEQMEAARQLVGGGASDYEQFSTVGEGFPRKFLLVDPDAIAGPSGIAMVMVNPEAPEGEISAFTMGNTGADVHFGLTDEIETLAQETGLRITPNYGGQPLPDYLTRKPEPATELTL